MDCSQGSFEGSEFDDVGIENLMMWVFQTALKSCHS